MSDLYSSQSPKFVDDSECPAPWDDIDSEWQHFIIDTFATKLKANYYVVKNIFDLAKPVVTLGYSYWRIDPENGVLLKKLLTTYL